MNEERAAANISVFRFTTIGWQVRIEPKDGYTKYMTWIKPYYLPGQQVGNMMYTSFVIPSQVRKPAWLVGGIKWMKIKMFLKIDGWIESNGKNGREKSK